MRGRIHLQLGAIGGTAATATGLCAGTYTVTVADVNGCTATQTVSITAATSFTLTTTQTNVACFGGNTGTANVAVSGGTGPFSYSWLPVEEPLLLQPD